MSEIRLKPLPDDEDYWMYQFDELIFRTESLSKPANDRVISLGPACGIQMAYMARHPEIVSGKTVIEPFAGSGPLGLTALHLGAASACFVDINPRALEFLRYNATQNNITDNRTRKRHSL